MNTFFQRKAFLLITPKGEPQFAVNSGTGVDLKVVFEVEKDISLGLNTGKIWIYNLNKKHRDVLAHRRLLTNKNELGGEVEIYAGYGENYSLIFKGDILEASSTKEGGDYVTYIESRTGVKYISKVISRSFVEGRSYLNIIESIISDIGASLSGSSRKNLILAGAEKRIKSPESYTGPAFAVLQKIESEFKDKLAFSFNDYGFEILQRGVADATKNELKINQNQIIGSPEPEVAGFTFKTLMRPEIIMGQLLTVDSLTIRSLYKTGRLVADKVFHRGDNWEGEWISVVRGIYEDAPTQIQAI